MCNKILRFAAFALLLVTSANSTNEAETEMHQTALTYIRLAKIVIDFRDEYQASNVFIARRDPSSDLLVSRALTTLMKMLSDTDVFSIITQLTNIPRIIDYSTKNLGRPVFIVIIRSTGDLKTLANVTRTVSLNLYRTLVIFSKNMVYCNEPVGNPLHLVFDMKMWVICQGNPIVQEWYSFEPNKTETVDLLIWSPNVPGFRRFTNKSFYERRNSLRGKSLRLTVLERSRLEQGTLTGFFGTVLLELARLANFKIDLQPPEELPGSYDPLTKNYTGILDKLYRGMTDIGAGDLTISKERLDFCDFSKPMLLSKANFYIRKPSNYYLIWSMYYNAFGLRTSYSLLIFLLVSPILIATVVHNYNTFSFVGNVYENYLNVWGIFCAKSPSDFPEQWSARIAYYSLYALSFMLYSAYSAMLVSYLANFNADLPFHSLEEFVAANTHRITTIKNTSYIDTFRISNDKVMRKLNNFLLDDKDLPATLTAAVNQACDNNMRVVLYMDDAILSSNRIKLPCELIPFERGRLASLALAFVKRSPYIGLINFHLQRMRNVGLFNAIKDRHHKKQEMIPEDYKPVDLYGTTPAFVILYFGMALSATLMVIENGIFYCFKRCTRVTSPSIHWLEIQNGLIRKSSSRTSGLITK